MCAQAALRFTSSGRLFNVILTIRFTDTIIIALRMLRLGKHPLHGQGRIGHERAAMTIA